MLVEKMHVMGLPNRETGSSMGRKRSVFSSSSLDYDKYFWFPRPLENLQGDPPIFVSLKCSDDFPKPQANIIQGWGWGGRGRTTILHSSGSMRFKIPVSRIYICHMSAQAEGIHQENIFTISAGSQN